jgi:hypothetical protein
VKDLNRSLPTDINNALAWQLIVVTGESGSGKTYSVIAACHIAKEVTIIMVPNDFAEHSGKRQLAAELKLMSRDEREKLFVACLDSFLAKVIDENTLYKAGKLLQESDVPITLFLDEMGETPSLMYAMSEQQGKVHALIKKHTKTTSSKLYCSRSRTSI